MWFWLHTLAGNVLKHVSEWWMAAAITSPSSLGERQWISTWTLAYQSGDPWETQIEAKHWCSVIFSGRDFKRRTIPTHQFSPFKMCTWSLQCMSDSRARNRSIRLKPHQAVPALSGCVCVSLMYDGSKQVPDKTEMKYIKIYKDEILVPIGSYWFLLVPIGGFYFTEMMRSAKIWFSHMKMEPAKVSSTSTPCTQIPFVTVLCMGNLGLDLKMSAKPQKTQGFCWSLSHH